ncbi:hypothetical protein IC582_028080 [Cucumis melo]|uniref:Classical arabinogalactan protein 9 n=2 Tax=Cucumis melo TaxID=3656 RepID=A0A1S3CQ09_CUCME|nr:classical arabinogalactan protein 9 [Cucumis melo]KAA0036959.1 classical arabinogalactan protein 9 [Cucumis melo var. makuwa]TYK21248.1 classical arabinogalactan protein 9 [Cucumis melo var. makuwa]
MAKVASFCCAVLSVLLLMQVSVSADSPAESPAPPPQTGVDSPPPRAPSSISSPPDASPRNAPVSSPPSPPPSDLAPDSSPTSPPPPPSSSPAPSPPPSEASDVSRNNVISENESDEESKDGMSGAKKFGIAIGVIAAVALIGFGGMVYKKRQDNIRRSHYGYTARREIL